MIQENQGKAELMKARQDAEKIQKLSEADAYKVKKQSEAEAFKIKITAEAEADKEARVGISKAIAAKEQVNAYGGPQYKVINDVMTSFANAVKEGKIDIVPKILVNAGGSAEGAGTNAFESLIILLLSEKLGGLEFSEKIDTPDGIKKIKDEILSQISKMNNDLPVIEEKE